MPVTYCVAKGEDIVKRGSEARDRSQDKQLYGKRSIEHLQKEEAEGGMIVG